VTTTWIIGSSTPASVTPDDIRIDFRVEGEDGALSYSAKFRRTSSNSGLAAGSTITASAAATPGPAKPAAAKAKATACAHTVEHFIAAVDKVMAENPRSINKYNAVLSKYLFMHNGIRGLPQPAPDASIKGCNIDQVIKIAKHSKYFFMTDGPPRYAAYIVEFRNSVAKVKFALNKNTGDIVNSVASWIRFYP
jgi:hypothetical protein